MPHTSQDQLRRFCLTMKVLKGRIIWGEVQRLCYHPLCADFLLIGWWLANGAVLQESCTQPGFIIFHLGRRAFLVAQMVKICLQSRRPRFDPWVRKIPCRRKRLPTPVFLPREYHGHRSLVGYSPWGHRVGHN